MSNLVVAQLLYLESENPEKPVGGGGGGVAGQYEASSLCGQVIER